MRTVIFLALRQLWARKVLSGIAMGAVSLGVLVLIAMSGVMLGFRGKFLSNMLKVSPQVTLYDKELLREPPILQRGEPLLVATESAHEVPTDRVSRIKRPTEIIHAVEAMEGVIAAAPVVSGSAVISYGSKELPVEVRGIEAARQERVTPLGPYLIAGRMQTFQASTDGVLLGSGVAARIGAKLGDTVRVGSPKGEPRVLKVVGLFEAGIPPVDNARIYVPLRLGQQIVGRPDAVGRIEVRLADSERAPAIAARVETLSGYDAESWQETNANFLSLFKMQDKITGFVIGSILLVGGFGILAIQIMIVLSKTRDISILRSVGFTRRDILVLFLAQGGLVALMGGAIGDVLGWLAARGLSHVQVKMETFVKAESFVIDDKPEVYLLGLVFALLVGVLASMLPARRAARVEPVDVLRGQIG